MELWPEETVAEIEAAMTPKQKKVVNFMVGQAMRTDARKYDPKLVRRMVIQKLVETTHEEEAA